ncbi:MAG: nucleotide exchange factor GrpE [Candidatus Coatesbacteria bacterium]|nr:MAG: nucleotide exchange factor GrpE [Candidatus Coatesbacteria bacterium]
MRDKSDKKVEVRVEPPATGETDSVATLEAKLAAAEAAATEAREELLRRAADLDNTKKRLLRDHERACAAAARGIVEKLLPVLDDLTRAIDAADADEAVPQNHVDSIRMLDRKIYDTLRQEGLEAIPAARGDAFDPEVHEAVAVTCDPTLPPNVIASVLDPGYKFHGVLLKPVRVEVCVPAAGSDSGEAPASRDERKPRP